MPNNLTSTPSTDKRPFQAIDGTELEAIILAEVKRVMDGDAKFKRHLTYPVFSFAFNIVIHAYPMEPPEFNVSGRYRRVDGEIPKGEPERIELEGRLDVDAPAEEGLAPDQARERAGLAVPMPAHAQLGKSGSMTVDEAQLPKMPDLDMPPEDAAVIASGQPSPAAMAKLAKERSGQGGANTAPASPKNRQGASPNFARSVDLATRAAPDGTRVDDNIGTVK